MWNNVCRVAFIVLCLTLLSGGKAHAQSVTVSEPIATTMTGTLVVNWGDLVVDGRIVASTPEASLFTDGGETIPIEIDPALAASFGGLEALHGKRVAVNGLRAGDGLAAAGLTVLDLTVLDSVTPSEALAPPPANPIGHSKWIFLLCAALDSPRLYSDPVPHYTKLLGGTKPALGHYWAELSYGLVDLEGSAAAGWFPLPQSAAYYALKDTNFPDAVRLNGARVATDCLGAADASVDFSQYEGVGFFVPLPRSVLGMSAVFFGGMDWFTVDGSERAFRTIWSPAEVGNDPDHDAMLAAANVIGHEMGHGFGLPHSSAQYGEVYDSIWDVMSWDNCGVRSPDFRCFPQHTIGYHKDRLGWLAPSRQYTLTAGSPVELELTRLALPPQEGYLLLEAPIGDTGRFYTAEARQRVGYDIGLPMNGVIIHEVDPVYSPNRRRAQVVDGDNDGNPADEGTVWTPGETFHGEGGFELCVLRATPTGFRVAAGIAQSLNCQFAVDFSPSSISADDQTPAAGQAITLSIKLHNYGIPADQVVVTTTVPAGTTYVTDTATTTHGQVLTATLNGPIVFTMDTVTSDEPVQLDYTLLVQEDVVLPTLLLNTTTIGWGNETFTLTKRLVANAKAVAAIEMSAQPPTVVADGKSSTQIQVVIKDAEGQLLLMPDDLLTMTSSSGIIAAPIYAGEGTATAVLTSTTSVGTATVMATTGSVSATLEVSFVAGPPATIQLDADPESLQLGVDSQSVITAVVADAYGNFVANQPVTFSTTLGTITSPATTNAQGVATAVLNVPSEEGVAIVSATTGGVSDSLTIRVAHKPYNVFLPAISR